MAGIRLLGEIVQELRFELVALGDVDVTHLIGQPAFLQHDGDLPSVGGRPVIELDRL
jgi:hypothetical protein